MLDVRGSFFLPPSFATESLACASLINADRSAGLLHLARVLHALKKSLQALTERYRRLARLACSDENVAIHSFDQLPDLVCPISFKNNIIAKCTQQVQDGNFLVYHATKLSNADLPVGFSTVMRIQTLFAADDSLWPSEFVIKFSHTAYGWEAHKIAADAGHAPALFGVVLLPGNWFAVAFERLDGYCHPDDLRARDIQAAYKRAFASKSNLHGDLRKENILVKTIESASATSIASRDVRFVDFDRAGKDGKVYYPLWSSNAPAGEKIEMQAERDILGIQAPSHGVDNYDEDYSDSDGSAAGAGRASKRRRQE